MANETKKFMSADNLLYVWQKVKLLLVEKVDKVDGKGLSTNDFTTAEKEKLATLSNYVDTEIRNLIAAINAKIPAEASATNQLTDKAFVNSSIATNTATFRGTFDSVEELPTTGVDNNDYAFVISTDASGNTVYNRYKYDGSIWEFEYALNNSSFTAEQWEAINSGISQTYVEKIDTNETTITNHIDNKDNPHQVTKSQVGLGNVDNTADADKPISTATQNALNLKEDKNNLKALAYKDSLSKSDVGLGNVDNTSDLNKPISTATQNALNLKANSSALTNYVDKSSNQTITGLKDFDVGVLLGNNHYETDESIEIDGGVLSSPDLNNITTRGIYHCSQGTNTPSFDYADSTCDLMVFNSSESGTNLVTQIAILGWKWWIRRSDGSTWGAWERFGAATEINELTNAEIDTIFAS